MIHPGYEYRDLCLIYTVVYNGLLGTKRSELEELQVTCTSQWLFVHLEPTIFDKLGAPLACVERKVKFQCEVLKTGRLFRIREKSGLLDDKID